LVNSPPCHSSTLDSFSMDNSPFFFSFSPYHAGACLIRLFVFLFPSLLFFHILVSNSLLSPAISLWLTEVYLFPSPFFIYRVLYLICVFGKLFAVTVITLLGPLFFPSFARWKFPLKENKSFFPLAIFCPNLSF